MSDVEARQLRYYLAVAEELHFGRAAERLGMAQPPLSRAIRTLERQLGVRLLERTTRQVTLTAAGEVLVRDARTALDAISAAARRAQNAGRPTPALRLALKTDYDAELLPQILDAYRREEASLPVELVLGGRGEQEPALRDGRADVALLPTPFDDRGLDVEHLLTEPRLVALAADDPLAARSVLRLADLAGRTLPDGNPADRGGLPIGATGDTDGGGSPRTTSPTSVVEPRPTQLDSAQIFNVVELGGIVWFPPASLARRHPRPNIAYRTVRDLPPTTLMVAWPQASRSPAVAAFVRAATTVADATPAPVPAVGSATSPATASAR
jgi:DNA-binding transcriptional LysR family regulator